MRSSVAAALGVLVCMITDWFGTGNRRVNAMHAQLERPACTTASSTRGSGGITRTHRKICVADGEIALVGGININDDMFATTTTASAWSAALGFHRRAGEGPAESGRHP